MEEFNLKDGYILQTDGKGVYAKAKEDKILRCPYCYEKHKDISYGRKG